MGRRSHLKSCATSKNAQIKLEEEECASSMGQNPQTNYAATMAARSGLKEEAYASSMGQKSHADDVTRKDALTML